MATSTEANDLTPGDVILFRRAHYYVRAVERAGLSSNKPDAEVALYLTAYGIRNADHKLRFAASFILRLPGRTKVQYDD